MVMVVVVVVVAPGKLYRGGLQGDPASGALDVPGG
jgi:hypothetical protein